MILHRDPDYPCISIVFNHNNALSFLFCYYDNKQKLCGWKPQRKWLGTVLYLDSFMKAAQAAKSFKLVFKNPNSMHIWKIFTVEKSIYYFTLPVCLSMFNAFWLLRLKTHKYKSQNTVYTTRLLFFCFNPGGEWHHYSRSKKIHHRAEQALAFVKRVCIKFTLVKITQPHLLV